MGDEHKAPKPLDETGVPVQSGVAESSAGGLPEDTAAVQHELVAAQFSGPLPPPGILEAYGQLVPDMPERLLAMVEKEGDHRRQLESRGMAVQEAREVRRTRGQKFAFSLALIVIAVGAALIWNGRDVGGLVAIIGTVATLAAVFIVEKYVQLKLANPLLHDTQAGSVPGE